MIRRSRLKLIQLKMQAQEHPSILYPCLSLFSDSDLIQSWGSKVLNELERTCWVHAVSMTMLSCFISHPHTSRLITYSRLWAKLSCLIYQTGYLRDLESHFLCLCLPVEYLSWIKRDWNPDCYRCSSTSVWAAPHTLRCFMLRNSLTLFGCRLKPFVFIKKAPLKVSAWRPVLSHYLCVRLSSSVNMHHAGVTGV